MDFMDKQETWIESNKQELRDRLMQINVINSSDLHVTDLTHIRPPVLLIREIKLTHTKSIWVTLYSNIPHYVFIL